MHGNYAANLRPADLAAVLPPAAAGRWMRLSDARAEVFGGARSLSDRIEEERLRLHAAEASIGRMRDSAGRPITEDHPAVVEQRQVIAQAKAEISRLQSIRDDRSAQAQAVGRIVSACEMLLGSNKAFETQNVDIEMRRSETDAAALERIQRRLRELDADRHRIESMQFPLSVTGPKAKETIERLAAMGAPDVTQLVEHFGDVVFPVHMQRLPLAAVGGDGKPVAGSAYGEAFNPLALICWLHKDALLARINEALAQETDAANAMTPEQREQKLAVIAADKLAAEYTEAALCWRMIDNGSPFSVLREDVAPQAVLGIRCIPKSAGSEQPYRRQGFSLWPFGSGAANAE